MNDNKTDEVRPIIKTGNSFGVTLTPNFLKEKNLKKGDLVRVDKITKVELRIVEKK